MHVLPALMILWQSIMLKNLLDVRMSSGPHLNIKRAAMRLAGRGLDIPDLEGFEPPSLYSIQNLVYKSNQANDTQSLNSYQTSKCKHWLAELMYHRPHLAPPSPDGAQPQTPYPGPTSLFF